MEAALLDLLLRFGRHVRNTDELSPTAWAVQGGNLLAELQALDPAGYEVFVKALPSEVN